MFIFGVGGSVLPYIISIIAIWSGIWLGHAHLLSNSNQTTANNEIQLESNTYLTTVQSNTYQWSDQLSSDSKIIEENKNLDIVLVVSEIWTFFDSPPKAFQNIYTVHKLRGPPSFL